MKYFLDKNISLRRLRRLDANRSVYSATGTSAYPCSWQEPSPDRAQFYEGDIGNLFECYVEISCPGREGDEVVKNGVIYTLRDVKTMDFGSTQYKRFTVAKGDDR
jgi:hypothetical protein